MKKGDLVKDAFTGLPALIVDTQVVWVDHNGQRHMWDFKVLTKSSVINMDRDDLDYLVYFGNQPDLKHLKSCVSNLYKKKNNVGFHATRNPFNKGSPYNAYIFKIDKLKLSNC